MILKRNLHVLFATTWTQALPTEHQIQQRIVLVLVLAHNVARSRIIVIDWERSFVKTFKTLKPNDAYRGRTAPLTSKRCILYIYSTNIGTEYFNHGINSSCFPLQSAVCFIILSYLVPVLFTFYIQGVLKLKKNNSGSKRLILKNPSSSGYFVHTSYVC